MKYTNAGAMQQHQQHQQPSYPQQVTRKPTTPNTFNLLEQCLHVSANAPNATTADVRRQRYDGRPTVNNERLWKRDAGIVSSNGHVKQYDEQSKLFR